MAVFMAGLWVGSLNLASLAQSALPKQVFSDETIHVHAQLKHKPTATPTLRWTVEHDTHEERAQSIEWHSAQSLPRMVAGAEIASSNDEEAVEALALKYQLASPYTHLTLVHVRDSEDKAQGLTKLQKIQHMRAAGWGGAPENTASRSAGCPRAKLIIWDNKLPAGRNSE
jgi:hypothetical protein